jgi:hypothetical protein
MREDPGYPHRFDEADADALDSLKLIARQRAGKNSDVLLMFLIKQADPSFREHPPKDLPEKTQHRVEINLDKLSMADLRTLQRLACKVSGAVDAVQSGG